MTMVVLVVLFLSLFVFHLPLHGQASFSSTPSLPSEDYCELSTCWNWRMVVLLIFSRHPPPSTGTVLFQLVHNMTISCERGNGSLSVAFASMNENPRLNWLNSTSDVDKYDRDDFHFKDFVQDTEPRSSQFSIVTDRLIGQLAAMDGDGGQYILIFTDYVQLVNSVTSNNIRLKAEKGKIQLKMVIFKGYNNHLQDTANEGSDELIAEQRDQIVEVDSAIGLRSSKIPPKIFPCHLYPPKLSDSSEEALEEEEKEEREEEEKRPKRPPPPFVPFAWMLIAGLALMGAVVTTAFCVIGTQKWRKRRKITPRTLHNSSTFPDVTQNYYAIHVNNEWLIESEKLIVDYSQRIGSGAFSMVYKGKLIGSAPVCRIFPSLLNSRLFIDCEVAVKTLPLHSFDETAREDFIQEINVMKALGVHSHLVSMLGMAMRNGNGMVNEPCLVVEYCRYGDLLHFVRERKNEILSGGIDDLKFKDLLGFAWQISDGMYYLSCKEIIHRDLAARNIFVDQNRIAKIGDFGLCRNTGDAVVYTSRGGRRLPLKWMSIESLRLYESSSASDVWSFGVVLFELFSLGDVPYPNVQPVDMIQYLIDGHRLEPPAHCTTEMRRLMIECWQEHPLDRPTFAELRQSLAEQLEAANENYGYVSVQSSDLYQRL